MIKRILFFLKFFLKGGYCNDLRRLKFTTTSWIGKSVSIFFEKPSGSAQSISLGEGVRIGHFSDLTVGIDDVINIKDFTTLNTHCKISGDVTIERYCLLSSNIFISSGVHYATRYPHLLIRRQDERVLSDKTGRKEHSKPVHIEEDVWIGFGVFIKRGITIGRGAVISANSVVLNDIPPYEIHGGAPARKLKDRLDFRPKKLLDALHEEDWPYFYRGFNQYHTNASESTGLVSHSKSSIAIPFHTNQIVVCKGFLLSGLKPITISVSIDNEVAGEYGIHETAFEFRIQITNDQFLRRKVTSYSFLNFECGNEMGSSFGINSIEIIDPV